MDVIASLNLTNHLPGLYFILVTIALLVFFAYVCAYQAGESPWQVKINQSFYQEIEREIGLAALSPLLITVYVRLRQSRANFDADDYSERLVVVSPQNWMIYTHNGINFHFISNNIDTARGRCDTTRSLHAIEYHLLPLYQQFHGNLSEKLRLSCVHYTYDQLIRIFARSANKTTYNLADYFDKKKNDQAPDLTIEEILDVLIVNSII